MQDQSLRALADRLRLSIRRAETLAAQIRRYWSPADLSVGVECLRALRQHQRIAPTTQHRKVLLARAKVAQVDLVRVLAELRAIVRKRSDAPLIDATAPVMLLPDVAQVATPVEPVRLRLDEPEDADSGNLVPWSDYTMYKEMRRRDGTLGEYRRAKRLAQARYGVSDAGKRAQRKYARSEKGKAARKRAQARYRAKLKAQQLEQTT